jgi:methionine-rich copper-binding protein CopC
MKRLLVASVAAWGCVLGAQVYAHHTFEATYAEDQAVTIEGELVQVHFQNPHSFVRVTVMEEDGSMARYAVEWGGAAQLGTQGVTSETLKLGDHVVISGNPGRNPSDHRVRMISLRRPRDGFGWVESSRMDAY